MATGDVQHAQWTASAFEWNAVTMEAFNTRGSGKKRKPGASSCQVPGCNVDLSDAKPYFKRHCICSTHMKAAQVLINGEKMRYCQQCGHFENLDQFIGGNRSCKMSLDRRSAIAQASKQKAGRSVRSRDQQIGREQSTSDNTSSDKGDGSGGKGSAWGSPGEVGRIESSQRTALGDPACPTRDVDMAADSSNPQGMSLGGRASVPVAHSPPAAISQLAPPRDIPVLNLKPAGAASKNINCAAHPNIATHTHHTDDITNPNNSSNLDSNHYTALINRNDVVSLVGLNLQSTAPSGWYDVEISDGGSGGVDGGGGSGGGGGGSKEGAGLWHPPRSQLGAAAPPVRTLLSSREGSYPQVGSAMLLSMRDQPMRTIATSAVETAASAVAGNGLCMATRTSYGSSAGVAAISGNQTLTYPRSGRLLGGASMQPRLFSAAPSAVVAALGAMNLPGIHDPGLEMQLQDIVNAARLEDQGWYGITSATSTEVSLYAPTGAVNDRMSMLRVDNCGSGGSNGNRHQTRQLCNLFAGVQANASARMDVDGGGDGGGGHQHGLMSGPRGASSPTSFVDAAAGGMGSRLGAPGDRGANHNLHHHPAGSRSSSCSSLQTCVNYLQQQQSAHQQQQQPHGPYGYNGSVAGAAGAGTVHYPHGAAVGAESLARSLGSGRGTSRDMLSYRTGEPDQLVRMALKLTSRAPDELEPSTIASIRKMLSVYDNLQSVQGYVRPGCTQLIIDAHRTLNSTPPVPAAAGGRGVSSNNEAAFDTSPERTDSSSARFTLGSNLPCAGAGGSVSVREDVLGRSSTSSSWWCDDSNPSIWIGACPGEWPLSLSRLLCEAGGTMDAEALLRNPSVRAALRDIATCNDTALTCQLDDVVLSIGEDGIAGETLKLTGLPTIVAASCAAVSADGTSMEITVYGNKLDHIGVTFWARMHGVCYQLQSRIRRGGGVVLGLPALSSVGLLHLETGAAEGPIMGPTYPLLVLPSNGAVEELHGIATAMGPASLRRFIADFGLVLGVNALLSQPLNGVVPSRGGPLVPLVTADLANMNLNSCNDQQQPSANATWGSTESADIECSGGHGGGGNAGCGGDHSSTVTAPAAAEADSIHAAEAAFFAAVMAEAEKAAAALMVANLAALPSLPQSQLQQQQQTSLTSSSRRRTGSSRCNSRHSSPACSGGTGGYSGILGGAADITEAMTNADDEQVVDLLLSPGAVRSLLETSLALLRIVVDRRMQQCARLIISRLCELAERFPDRVHSGLAPPPCPVPAFGLMHSAARSGDMGLLLLLMELEGLMGEHCSLQARGVNGVTPLHLVASLPQAPWLLRSLERFHPEVEQALVSYRADDGFTPLQLFQMLHMDPHIPQAAARGSQCSDEGGSGGILNPGSTRAACCPPNTPIFGAGSSVPSVTASALGIGGTTAAPLLDSASVTACSSPLGAMTVPVDMLLAAAAAAEAEMGSHSEAWSTQGEAGKAAVAAAARGVPRCQGNTIPSKNRQRLPSAADDLLMVDGWTDCRPGVAGGYEDLHNTTELNDVSIAVHRAPLTVVGAAPLSPSCPWAAAPQVLQQQQQQPRRQVYQPSYSTAPTSMAQELLDGADCGSLGGGLADRCRDMKTIPITRTTANTAKARLVAATADAVVASVVKAHQGPGLSHPLSYWPSFPHLTRPGEAAASDITATVNVGACPTTTLSDVATAMAPTSLFEVQSEAWTAQGEANTATKAAPLRVVGGGGVMNGQLRPIRLLMAQLMEDERLAALTALRSVALTDDSACGGMESLASNSSFAASNSSFAASNSSFGASNSNSTCCSVRNTAAAIAAAVSANEQWMQPADACWTRPTSQELLQQQQYQYFHSRHHHPPPVMPPAIVALGEGPSSGTSDRSMYGFMGATLDTLPEEQVSPNARTTRFLDPTIDLAAAAATVMGKSKTTTGFEVADIGLPLQQQQQQSRAGPSKGSEEPEVQIASAAGSWIRWAFGPADVHLPAGSSSRSNAATTASQLVSPRVLGPVLVSLGAGSIVAAQMCFGFTDLLSLHDGLFAHGSAPLRGPFFLTVCAIGLLLMLSFRLHGRGNGA